jgi:hypothetical protein
MEKLNLRYQFDNKLLKILAKIGKRVYNIVAIDKNITTR